MVQFISSRRGGRVLQSGGYLYHFEKKYKDKTFWKCVLYKELRCNGRMTTHEADVLTQAKHTHAPDLQEMEQRLALQTMRRHACVSAEPCSTIVKPYLKELDPLVAGGLPKNTTLKAAVRRSRRRMYRSLPRPRDMESLVIPTSFQNDSRGKPMLVYDNEDAHGRILIFSHETLMHHAATAQVWFGDGTFRVCPPPFKQIYGIHAQIKDMVFPLYYVLMQAKTEASYLELFQQMQALAPACNPHCFVADFERATLNALWQVFPTCKLHGCLFHFKKCIQRAVHNCGLTRLYHEDYTMQHIVKMLCCLPLVKECRVGDYYEALVQSATVRSRISDIRPLLDYMEDTWVGRQCNQGRRPARFHIPLWNCHDSILQDSPYTNNCLEGWHNSLRVLVGQKQPLIWSFLQKLQMEIPFQCMQISHHISGTLDKRHNLKTTLHVKALKTALLNFNSLPPLEFLQNAAFILRPIPD